jgi:carboxymethylenebutenolidase
MMFIERTYYFAMPGKERETLAVRRKACRVRVGIGLPAGRVFGRADPNEPNHPDVTWECRFASLEEHAADLAARAASPAFEAVRAEMRSCIARFERYFFKLEPTELPNGITEADLRGHSIAPRELAFRSGERTLKGYLFLPSGPGPFPCMISNHGSGIAQGTLDVSRPGSAALLMSWGIAAFLPHRRGYGNSPGPAWRSEVPAEPGTSDYDAQLSARLERESDDVLAALDCIRGLDRIRSDHIGVMGSSFGGVNSLLAAAKTDRFRCVVEFAGAAMNWEIAPVLREKMLGAARSAAPPIFFIQAANDYSTAPTVALTEARQVADKPVQSAIYPAFGVNAEEGHLLEKSGSVLWGEDVRRFLERHL